MCHFIWNLAYQLKRKFKFIPPPGPRCLSVFRLDFTFLNNTLDGPWRTPPPLTHDGGRPTIVPHPSRTPRPVGPKQRKSHLPHLLEDLFHLFYLRVSVFTFSWYGQRWSQVISQHVKIDGRRSWSASSRGEPWRSQGTTHRGCRSQSTKFFETSSTRCIF